MSPPPYFDSPAQDLAATREATETLLRSVAASGDTPDARTIDRLEKLAAACGRLAYPNGLASSLTESVHFLIAWCDHLDDPEWTANFILALQNYPLRSPW